jgi:hypothetical protein
VFVAEVRGVTSPSADPFVDNGRFLPVSEARSMLASEAERIFLDAAVASR